jgi:hypothetical protein
MEKELRAGLNFWSVVSYLVGTLMTVALLFSLASLIFGCATFLGHSSYLGPPGPVLVEQHTGAAPVPPMNGGEWNYFSAEMDARVTVSNGNAYPVHVRLSCRGYLPDLVIPAHSSQDIQITSNPDTIHRSRALCRVLLEEQAN